MKKLVFLSVFTVLFAIGMSAQTAKPAPTTHKPVATAAPAPTAAPTTQTQSSGSTTTASPAPAKNTVSSSRGGKKHKPVKAVSGQKAAPAPTATHKG